MQGAIDAFGRIDAVVNNAGILRDRTFHKMTDAEWDAVLKVHLYGAFNVTRAAMPHFREQEHGRIVVTTSVTGLYGNFGQANYGAAKLGLVGLVNTLALEGRSRNVLANAVSPLARTRMSVDILDDAFAPEFASVLVAYLVSDECTTTGEILHAAAGRYTRVRYAESRGVEFDSRPGSRLVGRPLGRRHGHAGRRGAAGIVIRSDGSTARSGLLDRPEREAYFVSSVVRRGTPDR